MTVVLRPFSFAFVLADYLAFLAAGHPALVCALFAQPAVEEAADLPGPQAAGGDCQPGVPQDADKQDAGLKGGLAGDAFVRVAVILSGGLGGEPVGLVVGIAGVV